MIHSCYDCYCLTDNNFYDSGDSTDSAEEGEPSLITSLPTAPPTGPPLSSPIKQRPLEAVAFQNTLPKTLTENKIVRFFLNLKTASGLPSDRGKIILKHWIHNGGLYCARTCGYAMKEAITIDLGHTIKDGYSLPLPKVPFIMGITLKKIDGRDERAARKRRYQELEGGGGRRRATFHDGLGPGMHLPSAPLHTDELLLRLAERGQYLSNIYLKSLDESGRGTTAASGTTPATVPVKGAQSETSSSGGAAAAGPPQSARDRGSSVSEGGPDGQDSTPRSEERPSTDAGLRAPSPARGAKGGVEDGREKVFSLYDMIKEEEKRGELELDLTPKEQGKAILVVESRFRKLLNMNIIGITGLNKSGR